MYTHLTPTAPAVLVIGKSSWGSYCHNGSADIRCIWPNSNVMKTEKKGYVTGWNLFVYQLCVCLSGPWERAHSLIMKCTQTCTKVSALSLRQPKRTEKPKWKKKGRQGNWHVMWGNSYPIIPNNSLSQDTSSALILQNPPQLIPNSLAPILSFISYIFLLLTSRLFRPLQMFYFKTKCLTEYLIIIPQLFLQMSTLTHVFERVRMCESAYIAFFFLNCCLNVCVFLWQITTNSRPEMLWTNRVSMKYTHYWIFLLYYHKALKTIFMPIASSELQLCNRLQIYCQLRTLS